MAARTTDTNTTPATDTDTAEALAVPEAVITHDRSTTPVGPGRITFKGHTAKAGYAWRSYEGRIQAQVDGAWVDAEDAAPVE